MWHSEVKQSYLNWDQPLRTGCTAAARCAEQLHDTRTWTRSRHLTALMQHVRQRLLWTDCHKSLVRLASLPPQKHWCSCQSAAESVRGLSFNFLLFYLIFCKFFHQEFIYFFDSLFNAIVSKSSQFGISPLLLLNCEHTHRHTDSLVWNWFCASLRCWTLQHALTSHPCLTSLPPQQRNSRHQIITK